MDLDGVSQGRVTLLHAIMRDLDAISEVIWLGSANCLQNGTQMRELPTESHKMSVNCLEIIWFAAPTQRHSSTTHVQRSERTAITLRKSLCDIFAFYLSKHSIYVRVLRKEILSHFCVFFLLCFCPNGVFALFCV